MARVPRATVDAFTRGINGLSQQARDMLAARLAQIDIADVSASAPEVVAVMEEYCGAAVRNVEALANRFYRMARMQALGVDTYDPDASSGRVPAATEEATRAILQQAVDGDVDGCVEQLLLRLDYEIKRGAGTTVLNAGMSDPIKPRYARVPTGAETCEFSSCSRLAASSTTRRPALACSTTGTPTAIVAWSQGSARIRRWTATTPTSGTRCTRIWVRKSANVSSASGRSSPTTAD